MCSSGTTGPPKGVCLSHASILERQTCTIDLKNHDVAFAFSSTYWISSIMLLISATLLGSTRIITTDSFTPERFIEIIKKFRVKIEFLCNKTKS